MRKLIVLLGLLFVTNTIEAQERQPLWREIFSDSAMLVHLDTNNIKRQERFIDFVERVTIKTEGAVRYGQHAVRYIYRYILLDCSDSTYIENRTALANFGNDLLFEQRLTLTRYTLWERVPERKNMLAYLPLFCGTRTQRTSPLDKQ